VKRDEFIPRRVAVFVALVTTALGRVQPGLAREWIDSSGKYRIEAEFVDLRNGQVQLKKATGEVITVGFDRLSPADRQYVTSHTSAPAQDSGGDAAGRQELLSQLLAKAEAAQPGDRYFIYRLALRYAPTDPRITTNMKNAQASVSGKGPRVDEFLRLGKAYHDGSMKDLRDRPLRNADMDVLELRILLDRDLTGNLRYLRMTLRHGEVEITAPLMPLADRSSGEQIVFASKPTIGISTVLKRHGEPSHRTDSSLTYGSVRLFLRGQVITTVVLYE
jgi:hypothetical protein